MITAADAPNASCRKPDRSRIHPGQTRDPGPEAEQGEAAQAGRRDQGDLAIDEKERQQRNERAHCEEGERGAAGNPRRSAQIVRVEPQLLARHRVEREFRIGPNHVVSQIRCHG